MWGYRHSVVVLLHQALNLPPAPPAGRLCSEKENSRSHLPRCLLHCVARIVQDPIDSKPPLCALHRMLRCDASSAASTGEAQPGCKLPIRQCGCHPLIPASSLDPEPYLGMAGLRNFLCARSSRSSKASKMRVPMWKSCCSAAGRFFSRFGSICKDQMYRTTVSFALLAGRGSIRL